MQTILLYVVQIFWFLLILRVIFSWITDLPEPLDKVRDFAYKATDWACEPLRRVIPPIQIGGVAFDVSIILVFILTGLVRSLIIYIF